MERAVHALGKVSYVNERVGLVHCSTTHVTCVLQILTLPSPLHNLLHLRVLEYCLFQNSHHILEPKPSRKLHRVSLGRRRRAFVLRHHVPGDVTCGDPRRDVAVLPLDQILHPFPALRRSAADDLVDLPVRLILIVAVEHFIFQHLLCFLKLLLRDCEVESTGGSEQNFVSKNNRKQFLKFQNILSTTLIFVLKKTVFKITPKNNPNLLLKDQKNFKFIETNSMIFYFFL
ncbi:unnamed protein product, partial [Vitis vinifera]